VAENKATSLHYRFRSIIGAHSIYFLAYKLGWDWTGFNGGYGKITIHTPAKDTELPTARTLWDWLQLLIIPLVLAVAALLFNLATTRTEQNIALDKQREDLLQAYLDRMSELLLKEKLRSSEADAEVRNVARVRTITILFQLDARRIDYVFAFLRESDLIKSEAGRSIVSLSEANFSKIDLREVNLHEVDLFKVNLFRANLSKANLSEANLKGANLSGAYLLGTNLSGADLSEADLSFAELGAVNLNRAWVTREQVEQAKSLQGTTMPDGSIHP
jgi:uncharacterized protein YjbI with pentapeptide repeats